MVVLKKRCVTREEYDDGAIVRNGKPYDIEAQLKVRYLTPYNFLIAPQASPINNKQADNIIEGILAGILRGEASLQDLIGVIHQLPKSEMDI